MEASETGLEPATDTQPAVTARFDPAEIHAALDSAEKAYHDLFDGHAPDEIHRFDAFLSTVRMIVDQSADSASKEQ